MRRSAWRRASAGVGRAAVAIVVAWLLLVLLSGWAVPPLVKWQAASRLGESTGRAASIDTVRFDPFRLVLTLEGLRIAGAASPEPLLTVRRLRLDLSAASLVDRAPVVEALDLESPRLRVARLAPGRYDIDDILRRLAAAPSGPKHDLRFALSNVQVRDGEIRFDDRPAGHVQAVTGLELSLPFASNFQAQLDVQIAPRVAFRLNGVAFDSSALATPFAASPAGAVRIAFRSLDLAPYLDYLPAALPVRLDAGRLSTDLSLQFALPPGRPPSMTLKGSVSLEDLRASDRDGRRLLALRHAEASIVGLDPVARRAELDSLRIDAPEIHLRRLADGGLAWPGSAPARSPGSADPPPAPADRWDVNVERLDLADGALEWTDAAVRPAAAFRLAGFSLGVERLHWPLRGPVDLAAQGRLEAPGAAGGRIGLRGSLAPSGSAFAVTVATLPLSLFEGYAALALRTRVDGRVSADARIDTTASGLGGRGVRVVVDTASVDDLALHRPDDPSPTAGAAPVPVAARRLAVRGARVDIASRAVAVEALEVESPSVALVRGADGVVDASRWLAAATPTDAPSTGDPAPWRFRVAETRLDDGRLQWTDASARAAGGADPVRLAFADLRLALHDVAWQGTVPSVPAHFEAGGRVGLPQARGEPASRMPGRFDWRGVVGIAPLEGIGSFKAERLPLHLLVPYAGADLPVRLAHLELGVDGQLSVRKGPAGWAVDAGADLLLGAVRIDAAPTAGGRGAGGETLVSWNTLGLKGAQLALKPGATPRVDVAEAALDDFFARLVVTEDGRLNVRELTAGSAPPAPAPAPAASSALPIELRLGGATLANGHVDFSDHFVKPNYGAALTALSGRLGPIDSTRPAMAALSLRGKAAGTAQLEIDGTVDPLAQPVRLDLRAKATDLELAPLSPYAGKYAGYAIERGKLSVDLAYRLGADGRLEASNRIVLQQLTFGERIASPSATSLPVRFAVSLLKDRDGVIDLDLPVRGSLNDPQFSVGAVIGRLLVNLLSQAITSPFSLLARGASGGVDAAGDPAQVDFVPGTARLTAAGRSAVETVAEALAGKPALLLTITGTADAAAEQGAYRSAVLDERIDAERKKASVASAAAASAALPPLDAESRVRLVRQLYRESDLPDKPRNVFGLAKDLPVAEMQARLEAVIDLTPDAARALALQRGVEVRDALVGRGVPSERLFLAAPKLDDGTHGLAPQARLSLSAR